MCHVYFTPQGNQHLHLTISIFYILPPEEVASEKFHCWKLPYPQGNPRCSIVGQGADFNVTLYATDWSIKNSHNNIIRLIVGSRSYLICVQSSRCCLKNKSDLNQKLLQDIQNASKQLGRRHPHSYVWRTLRSYVQIFQSGHPSEDVKKH
jgi:hypothetical protein